MIAAREEFEKDKLKHLGSNLNKLSVEEICSRNWFNRVCCQSIVSTAATKTNLHTLQITKEEKQGNLISAVPRSTLLHLQQVWFCSLWCC